jgi:hypothetical protein
MKIRWTENSVRLRITPSELAALERSEIVKASLTFSENENGWSAAILPGVAQTSVQLVSGSLLIRLSGEDRYELSEPDCEGVYFQQEDAVPIRYYIEKDFPCVHPRAAEAQEPPTETFAPPEEFEERKQP